MKQTEEKRSKGDKGIEMNDTQVMCNRGTSGRCIDCDNNHRNSTIMIA